MAVNGEYAVFELDESLEYPLEDFIDELVSNSDIREENIYSDTSVNGDYIAVDHDIGHIEEVGNYLQDMGFNYEAKYMRKLP